MESITLKPSSADFLFGKTDFCRKNGGNLWLKHLVLARFEEHEDADQSTDYMDVGKKKNRLDIKREIMAEVKVKGGRFLTQNTDGKWVEVDEKEVLARIVYEFTVVRKQHKKQKTLKSHEPQEDIGSKIDGLVHEDSNQISDPGAVDESRSDPFSLSGPSVKSGWSQSLLDASGPSSGIHISPDDMSLSTKSCSTKHGFACTVTLSCVKEPMSHEPLLSGPNSSAKSLISGTSSLINSLLGRTFRRSSVGEQSNSTTGFLSGFSGMLSGWFRNTECLPQVQASVQLTKGPQGGLSANNNPGSPTLSSVADRAELMRAQGKLEEAENLYREALEEYRRVLGDLHPDTLCCMSSMAYLLKERGKLQEAEILYNEAFEGNALGLAIDLLLSTI